ncbi:MAG TPA: SRPBCC domain-containing protein [Bacteroidota bacterium]|jgi:uncharacterized protein YndB with AHSA1/START domain|nr:SRPBCC domain-containing protein [Bacteroidota bacterium]
MSENLIAEASITIEAPIAQVWDALIDPVKIKQYMFGTTVVSEWKEGSSIVWAGEWEGKRYEDQGTILKVESPHTLRYNHFTPASQSSEAIEQYHTVTVELSGNGDSTSVYLCQDHNLSYGAKEHSERNWNMMLSELKKLLEVETQPGHYRQG